VLDKITEDALYADHIRQWQPITERWQHWKNIWKLNPKSRSTDLWPINIWLEANGRLCISICEFRGGKLVSMDPIRLAAVVGTCWSELSSVDSYTFYRARKCPEVLLVLAIPPCHLIVRDDGTPCSDQCTVCTCSEASWLALYKSMQLQYLVKQKIVRRAVSPACRRRVSQSKLHCWVGTFSNADKMLPKTCGIDLTWCIPHAKLPSYQQTWQRFEAPDRIQLRVAPVVWVSCGAYAGQCYTCLCYRVTLRTYCL
jgi:hypothetical protein